jgi:hypothetical protein
MGAAWARHGHGMACVYYHWPSRNGMWVTCLHSASSSYHADFHKDLLTEAHQSVNPLAPEFCFKF